MRALASRSAPRPLREYFDGAALALVQQSHTAVFTLKQHQVLHCALVSLAWASTWGGWRMITGTGHGPLTSRARDLARKVVPGTGHSSSTSTARGIAWKVVAGTDHRSLTGKARDRTWKVVVAGTGHSSSTWKIWTMVARKLHCLGLSPARVQTSPAIACHLSRLGRFSSSLWSAVGARLFVLDRMRRHPLSATFPAVHRALACRLAQLWSCPPHPWFASDAALCVPSRMSHWAWHSPC